MQRYILTGAPGAGKTVLLRRLELAGFPVVEEAATDLIALVTAKGVERHWEAPAFIDDIVALQRARQLRADAWTDDVVFFDRSPICTWALCEYARPRAAADPRRRGRAHRARTHLRAAGLLPGPDGLHHADRGAPHLARRVRTLRRHPRGRLCPLRLRGGPGPSARRGDSASSRSWRPSGALGVVPRGHLLGGADARAQGALDVALPLDGGLGAGPVDAAERLAQGVAVAGHGAGRHRADVAVGPRLGQPVVVVVGDRVGRRLGPKKRTSEAITFSRRVRLGLRR